MKFVSSVKWRDSSISGLTPSSTRRYSFRKNASVIDDRRVGLLGLKDTRGNGQRSVAEQCEEPVASPSNHLAPVHLPAAPPRDHLQQGAMQVLTDDRLVEDALLIWQPQRSDHVFRRFTGDLRLLFACGKTDRHDVAVLGAVGVGDLQQQEVDGTARDWHGQMVCDPRGANDPALAAKPACTANVLLQRLEQLRLGAAAEDFLPWGVRLYGKGSFRLWMDGLRRRLQGEPDRTCAAPASRCRGRPRPWGTHCR